MTPAARAQAAIEMLDAIIEASRAGGAAADVLIARYFKERRYAGSKDRRGIRELVYAAIRRAGECPANGRAALIGLAEDRPELAALFDGSLHGPAPIAPAERAAPAGPAPAWLIERAGASLTADELTALLERAPLDVRVNRLKATREVAMALLPQAVPTPHAPDGLRLPEGTALEQSPASRDGLIEVQDEGSQLVGAAVGAAPGSLVVDLCAGAGGKTLQLGAAMANSGRLIACDVDRSRLSRLMPRAGRAGLGIVESRLLDGGREAEGVADLVDAADHVLIDAPCSGMGTWRRNPEARWRLTPARLDRLVALQARLLDLGAALVRPGGHLTYVVCSLLDEEGSDQIAALMTRRPWATDLASLPAGRPYRDGWRLSPASDGTDGFFVARLHRPC